MWLRGWVVSAYDRIVDALHNAGSVFGVNDGRRATATCPAHDDRSPSLSIRKIEGSALLHCFAGCHTDDVLESLRLSKSDLFDNQRNTEYRYDNGRVVTRFYDSNGDKGFRQSGTNSSVELFHLSRLQQASDGGIFLVEGEKDVLAIESVGGIATTAPMGALTFSKVDVMPLAGHSITVVVDRDGPGAQWAQEVQRLVAPIAKQIRYVHAATGKDAADHIAAAQPGWELKGWERIDPPLSGEDIFDAAMGTNHRTLSFTRASEITPKPVHWIWQDRIAQGTLALLAGREGIGKSTIAYDLAASLTRGELPGVYRDQPKAVAVAATEDSWSHTIVPRLMAAKADLNRVLRVDVTTAEGVSTGLSLPRDLDALERLVRQEHCGLILLDPLISRLSDRLDTHKDADVRQALEPLTALADRTRVALLGLIHVSKGSGTDPLTAIMGSRAFAAVARSVLFAMKDPDNETNRFLGFPKNNLGRSDLPSVAYSIQSTVVLETNEGPIITGRVLWGSETSQSITDLLQAGEEASGARSAAAEAAEWLREYLTSVGGKSAKAKIHEEGKRAGHSESALRRARERLKLPTESAGYPRTTFWSLT